MTKRQGFNPGQKVLINGASGGVGTFAVQIAKVLGAEVTGVCSTRNLALVQSIGADHVIDYTREDFTQGSNKYDLIIDNVGSHSASEYRRVLKSDGTLVIVGGSSDGSWLGGMSGAIKAKLLAPFVSQKIGFFLARLDHEDLDYLRELLQAGKITPVIDRRYKLSETSEAMRYLEAGHARGKVVINPGMSFSRRHRIENPVRSPTMSVAPHERRALALAFACNFLLLGSYYILRPVRDTHQRRCTHV